MAIFYREKAFHAGKKIRKNDFAPSEKYACYAPACMSEKAQDSLLQNLSFVYLRFSHCWWQ